MQTETKDWERALAGDGAAFAAVFDLHRGRVFRHAHRLLQNADDAEDAVAVAFMELWRSRRRVRIVDGSVLPWLLVTVGNTARNLGRARRRHRALLDSLPHGEHHPSAEDQWVADEFDDQDVADALSALSASDMHLVDLVIFEGFSPSEAALLLGISAGTARTRLHRLRASLRERLRENRRGVVPDSHAETASTADGGHP